MSSGAPSCTPRFITLAQARVYAPFLERAREESRSVGHLAWAPLNDMPCWSWFGWTEEGYARMRWEGQANARVHIITYTMFRGTPYGVLDHLCRHRPCVNPWHLQDVTGAENTLRGARAEGICRNGLHEMVGANVITRFRDGLPRYECRACKEARRG